MRFLVLLFVAVMIKADELDFLDEIDQDESSFKVDKSPLDMRLKLSLQKNEESEDAKILYFRLANQAKNYQYDIRFIADENRQDFNIKELYYKGSFAEISFYEVGRINVKEGIAHGYNPTDYFKGSTSLTLSNDPKERKENRLGALLVSETFFLDKLTLKGLYAPKISVDKDSIFSNKKYIGLHLDETNYHDRASLFVDYSGFKDVSSSVILHYDEDNVHFGFNVSYVYDNWIMYLENSLKKGKSDITKSIEKNGISQEIYNHFHHNKKYIDQAVLGINYTSESNIVTTFEYIFNSGGLDKSDWDDWFELQKEHPRFTRDLGIIRTDIAESESLMSKQAFFVLSRASDIRTNLDASFLAWINPYDGSTLSQIGLEYACHDSLQTNLFVRNYQGKKESEYGSALNNYEVLIEAEYFF